MQCNFAPIQKESRKFVVEESDEGRTNTRGEGKGRRRQGRSTPSSWAKGAPTKRKGKSKGGWGCHGIWRNLEHKSVEHKTPSISTTISSCSRQDQNPL